MEGTVKWYDRKKGYGFITGSDGGDYFVHFSAMPEGMQLEENEPVTFDAVETERGKQAQNIQRGGAGAESASEEAAEESEEEQE